MQLKLTISSTTFTRTIILIQQIRYFRLTKNRRTGKKAVIVTLTFILSLALCNVTNYALNLQSLIQLQMGNLLE